MSQRSMTLTEVVEMVTEECCNCGVLFAMTAAQNRRLRDHPGTAFYCTNGHSQHYTAKSEAQKAKERAERLAQQLASRDEDLRAERMAHAATKGQLTKTKKRADAGVCQHCKRSFVNVARHVAHMHPQAS